MCCDCGNETAARQGIGGWAHGCPPPYAEVRCAPGVGARHRRTVGVRPFDRLAPGSPHPQACGCGVGEDCARTAWHGTCRGQCAGTGSVVACRRSRGSCPNRSYRSSSWLALEPRTLHGVRAGGVLPRPLCAARRTAFYVAAPSRVPRRVPMTIYGLALAVWLLSGCCLALFQISPKLSS